MEHNPNHPVTSAMHGQWHKVVAILVARHSGEVVISPAEVRRFAHHHEGDAVVIREESDGLHLRLVANEEARKLAKDAGGLLV